MARYRNERNGDRAPPPSKRHGEAAGQLTPSNGGNFSTLRRRSSRPWAPRTVT